MKYRNIYTGNIVTLLRCEVVDVDVTNPDQAQRQVVVNVLSNGGRLDNAQFEAAYSTVDPELQKKEA
jgi:hypothetical protein